MLSSSEVSAALTHPEPIARDHALLSLSLAGLRCGVMADVALSAIDLLGAEAFADPLSIRELPASTATVTRLVTSYSRRPNPQIGEWISELPQALLAGIDLGAVAGAAKSAVEHRLELGRSDPDALWHDLAANKSPAIMLAIVEHEQFLDGHLPPVLNVPGHPMELPAIELAGRIHFATVLEQLLDRFITPEPVGSAAVLAVARIGTAGAVTAIEHRCDRGPAAFRLRAAQCLARFRVPSAEATLHRLLMEEDQPEIVCALAESLATICTTTSLDRLLEVVRSGKCQDHHTKQLLAGLSVILKKPAAEAGQWAGGRTVRDRVLAESLRQTPAPGSSTIPATHLDAPADQRRQVAPPAPIRAAEKVGRNDPCPCGSGKKFKKCCGAQS